MAADTKTQTGERDDTGLQVLVVDDEADMRGYLCRCLAPLASRIGPIFEAGDGVEALHVTACEDIDLVITDVVMPRLDGLALSRRLESRRRQAGKGPIVLLVSEQIDADEARSVGAAGVLAKPFDGRTLRHLVTRLLEKTAS